MLKLFFAFYVMATVSSYQSKSNCQQVETQENFDLESYVSSRWYVHQQMITVYLPEEYFFCVYADYTIREEETVWGYTIDVYNYAEDADGDSIGGPLW